MGNWGGVTRMVRGGLHGNREFGEAVEREQEMGRVTGSYEGGLQ